jgi:Protein of unknown function (DUF3467)
MGDEHGKPRDADALRGQYANYLEVGHNAFEFLLDFGQHYAESAPGKVGEARLHTRIVTSPVYARAFLEILEDSINRYERAFGAIPRREGSDDDASDPR